jgi:hypothetical protein
MKTLRYYIDLVEGTLAERIPIGPGVSPEQTQAALDAKQQMSQRLSQQSMGRIDYTKEGPRTKSSLGHDLEYGIPVAANGSFMNPNRLSNYEQLGDDEYGAMITAYKTWLKDFLSRWPNAQQNPDGTWSKVKPGLAAPRM